MTQCWQTALEFPSVKRRKVEADFSGGDITSNGGIPLLAQTDQYLYDKVYCARGDMENRIKDQQLDLFAGRTSGHRWWAKHFRQLLSGLACTLFEGLRARALKDNALAKACPNRIRLSLLRIGAVVIRNTHRIRMLMSSACPHQYLFRTVAFRVNSS